MFLKDLTHTKMVWLNGEKPKTTFTFRLLKYRIKITSNKQADQIIL